MESYIRPFPNLVITKVLHTKASNVYYCGLLLSATSELFATHYDSSSSVSPFSLGLRFASSRIPREGS